MRRDQALVNETLSYFTQKQWIVHCCSLCARFVLLKENTMHPCPYCHSGIPDALPQARSPFHHTTRAPHLEVAQRLECFCAEKEQVGRVSPLPIWYTQKPQVFVGSGLEYIYPYKYRSALLPPLPALIFQPSIRLRGGITEKKLMFDTVKASHMSFAFVNVSLLRCLKEVIDFPRSLDIAIALLSALTIHAKRVCLVMDQQPHLFEDGYSSVIRIFVDHLQIGDHVALVNNRGLQTIIETGFGLERLTTCVFRCSYHAVIQESLGRIPLPLLKSIHALALITMSNMPFAQGEAWSKARAIAASVRDSVGHFDSFLTYRDMHAYWSSYVHEPAKLFSSYMQFLQLIT